MLIKINLKNFYHPFGRKIMKNRYKIHHKMLKEKGCENKKIIVLTGIAGCGKSTLGKILAEKLSYRFIDPDMLIEEEWKMSLDEVIEKLGVEEFSSLEERVFLKNLENESVIAPGGSIVYRERAMEIAMKCATIFWLKISRERWLERIQWKKPKGFLFISSKDLLGEFEAREKLYARYCHYTVNGEKGKEEILDEILKILRGG